MSLLGLDVGVRRCRGIAVSEVGQVLAHAQQDYVMGPEEPAGGVSVRAIWMATQDVVRKLALATRNDPLRALSVAGSAEGWVALLADRTVVGGRLLAPQESLDPSLREALDQVGDEAWFEITGRVPDSRCLLNTLLGWRRQHPAQWDGPWRLTPVTGLIGAHLGGSTACDLTLASSTALLDAKTANWSSSLLRAAQLPADRLPELRAAGQPVGLVQAKLARELGLPGQVQIMLGGRDLACGLLGAGATHAGLGLLHLGASLVLAPVFGALPLRTLMLAQGLAIEPHHVANLNFSEIEHYAGGRLLAWFCDQVIAQEARAVQKRGYSIYERLLAEMPTSPSPCWALSGREGRAGLGEAGGRPQVWAGFGLDATRGEIIKALLEGGAYHLAHAQQGLEGAGMRLERYRATGSGARAEQWLQLMADVLGRPVERLAMTETKTLGAALLAGAGSAQGALASISGAPWAKVQRTYEPDAKQHARYGERLDLYRKMTTRD